MANGFTIPYDQYGAEEAVDRKALAPVTVTDLSGIWRFPARAVPSPVLVVLWNETIRQAALDQKRETEREREREERQKQERDRARERERERERERVSAAYD